MTHGSHQLHNHVEPVRPQTYGSVQDAEMMSGDVAGDEDGVGEDGDGEHGGELDGDEHKRRVKKRWYRRWLEILVSLLFVNEKNMRRHTCHIGAGANFA